MNAKHVQDKVSSLFSTHDHQLMNKYIFDYDWESDFFSVTKSGYLYEVEIKISKSDYKADFEKFKHTLFEQINQKEVIKEAKYRYSKRWKKMVRRAPEKRINPEETKMPNRFFFACPEGVIDVDEVPEYAGLIYVNDFDAKVIKKAPLLHKRKENIKELLFSKYRWGYVNAIDKLEIVKKKHNSVSKKFNTMCRGLEKEFNLPDGSVTSITAFKRELKNSNVTK